MNDPKDHITVEVNGSKMPSEAYKIVKFLNGDIKVEVVYHDQPGFKEEE